jgi:hypothetical protein
MSYFDKKPLRRITLLSDEVHLHSAVLAKATSKKLFGFVGPRVYTIQPFALRYRAHITDQRLLMEIYPYSDTEINIAKLTLTGVSTANLIGKVNDQVAAQNSKLIENMSAYHAAANDPKAQCFAIPYDTLTVTTFGSITSYIKLNIIGTEKDEMVFVAQFDTEGRLLPRGNIVDNAKVGWRLSREFAKLCQEAIASYRTGA